MSYSKIGRYEITGTLGKGAMGVVYKAVDPTIGRTVALKTTRLDVHGSDQEELLERFRNEARLAGVLNHPNIVTIYDAGEFEGLFYIAMEFIEGQTLHQLLSKKKVIPIAQTLEIARQVCAGLDCAAGHRVVHRDIKPANIMLEATGTAKIMDFGIAKAGGGLTSTGQVLGTPNYMSPEQVRGKPLDGRSDLFSLGVMLYEMVTGSKPFVGDNVTTIIYKIIHEDPPPPREVNVSVHPGLAAVIVKALEKNPNNRYQNGAELARDLANYKAIGDADEPTTRVTPVDGAEPGSTSAAAARAATSKPIFAAPEAREAPKSLPLMPLLASIAAAIAIVAIGIVAYVRHSQAQQRSELERLLAEQKPAPTANQLPAPAAAVTPETAVVKAPALSPASTGGELVLNTNPAGAQVRIDGRGQESWRTPFISSEVKPGAHTVTLSLAGYANESRKIDVSAGHQAFLAVTLKPQEIIANISSAPSAAEIFIDGSGTGKTTPAQIPLAPGDHSLLLRKSGYSDLSTTLHARPDLPQAYSAELLPAGKESNVGKFRSLFTGGKVPVSVRTTPRGAQIVINGVLVQGKNSPMRLGLDPGSYDVVLQLSGYKPLHKTVTVEKGTSLELDETLEKQN